MKPVSSIQRPSDRTNKKQQPLPLQYFAEYADDSEDRSYAQNWRDYGFSRFTDYLRLLKENYAREPESVFECGSADGSVIRELLHRRIEARGCEFTREIVRTCHDPDIRRRISIGDAYEIVKALPDRSFDCVYETSAQYIPHKRLSRYFQELRRVTRNDLVIVLHTVEEDATPHQHQINHLHNQEWVDIITGAGFVLGYINAPEEATAPFWFRKVG